TIRSWNGGVDLGAFNDRLTATFDIYRRYTDNMMGPAPSLPATLGTGVPNTNNTDLRTSGWELSLGWRDRVNTFSYGVRLNLADSRTVITKYPNETNNIGTYLPGFYTNEIWGFQTIGIAKS